MMDGLKTVEIITNTASGTNDNRNNRKFSVWSTRWSW